MLNVLFSKVHVLGFAKINSSFSAIRISGNTYSVLKVARILINLNFVDDCLVSVPHVLGLSDAHLINAQIWR